MKIIYALALISLALFAGCGAGSNAVDCEGHIREIRDLGTYSGHAILVICANGTVKKLR